MKQGIGKLEKPVTVDFQFDREIDYAVYVLLASQIQENNIDFRVICRQLNKQIDTIWDSFATISICKSDGCRSILVSVLEIAKRNYEKIAYLNFLDENEKLTYENFAYLANCYLQGVIKTIPFAELSLCKNCIPKILSFFETCKEKEEEKERKKEKKQKKEIKKKNQEKEVISFSNNIISTSTNIPPIGPPKTSRKKEQESNRQSIHELIENYYKDDELLKIQELWCEYVEMRLKVRKPLTAFGAKLAILKLQNWNIETACKSLEQSIFNSWQGLFEPRVNLSKDDPDAEFRQMAERIQRRLGNED